MQMKKLYRSETDTKLAGICGGLGEEFGIDGNMVRLATVFACAVSGVAPLVITYIVAWIILPKGKPLEE
jgi:phage shock protein C